MSPSPRDWPEDATHENGSYQCRCCVCHEIFIGHKRRVVCHVCSDRDEAEAKRRAEWLHAHGAPSNWTVHTIEEVRAMRADYADLLLRLHVERKVRRAMADAMSDIDDIRPQYPDSKGGKAWAALDESQKLDVEIEERARAKATPVSP